MNYRRFNIILLIALLSLGPALVLAPWIHEHAGALYPGCFLEQLTGRSCPMCGLTTGLRDLVTGNMQRSNRNPLTVTLALIILLEIAGRALCSAGARYHPSLSVVRYAGMVACIPSCCSSTSHNAWHSTSAKPDEA
jgi:hypothetical protein